MSQRLQPQHDAPPPPPLSPFATPRRESSAVPSPVPWLDLDMQAKVKEVTLSIVLTGCALVVVALLGCVCYLVHPFSVPLMWALLLSAALRKLKNALVWWLQQLSQPASSATGKRRAADVTQTLVAFVRQRSGASLYFDALGVAYAVYVVAQVPFLGLLAFGGVAGVAAAAVVVRRLGVLALLASLAARTRVVWDNLFTQMVAGIALAAWRWFLSCVHRNVHMIATVLLLGTLFLVSALAGFGVLLTVTQETISALNDLRRIATSLTLANGQELNLTTTVRFVEDYIPAFTNLTGFDPSTLSALVWEHLDASNRTLGDFSGAVTSAVGHHNHNHGDGDGDGDGDGVQCLQFFELLFDKNMGKGGAHLGLADSTCVDFDEPRWDGNVWTAVEAIPPLAYNLVFNQKTIVTLLGMQSRQAVEQLVSLLKIVFAVAFNGLVQMNDLAFKLVVFVVALYQLLVASTNTRALPFPHRIAGRLMRSVYVTVKGSFVLALKMLTFHVFFTYLAYQLCGVSRLVVFYSCLSGALAVVPIVPHFIASLPGAVELAVRDHYSAAVVLVAVHCVLPFTVHPAIYREVPHVSPTVVGYSIAFGLYRFSPQGVLLGPMLACVPEIAYRLYEELLALSGRSSSASDGTVFDIGDSMQSRLGQLQASYNLGLISRKEFLAQRRECLSPKPLRMNSTPRGRRGRNSKGSSSNNNNNNNEPPHNGRGQKRNDHRNRNGNGEGAGIGAVGEWLNLPHTPTTPTTPTPMPTPGEEPQPMSPQAIFVEGSPAPNSSPRKPAAGGQTAQGDAREGGSDGRPSSNGGEPPATPNGEPEGSGEGEHNQEAQARAATEWFKVEKGGRVPSRLNLLRRRRASTPNQ